MTLFVSCEAVEGKLIANPNGGKAGEPDYCGCLELVMGDWEGVPRLRVPLLAFEEGQGDALRYRLNLSGIEGFMELKTVKYSPLSADFEGIIDKQLEVAAWREYNSKDGWHLRLRAWGYLFSNGEWTRSTEALIF
ncbi:TPA: hypothetical protein SL901_005640 [Pseudomonas aeruginosa]|uniref:Uncharacterized protein n=3 Tax=Pseudomonas TaxID=286 RepID=A0A2K4W2K9_9PSED|nr:MULTISPECIES: hypothetical protein [Pseudomonas]PHX41359.1 hypothetical protein AO263_00985 [Pseudomonas sp. NZIPFR-PS5]PYD09433.1 hypothetical protein DND47_29550 [Pseudomonas syringae pv. syringae]HCL4077760.1 hypothetical protein [Pseudomonas aeruginosa]MBE8591825.1 hypothetical protein [Pseudomonas cyclaminis]MBE8599494.1 hypothetical protein [Pseudomonas cyclaminis]